ncbi:MAG: ABC transporter ATP-binding protein [Lachnospiraceae bacterium]
MESQETILQVNDLCMYFPVRQNLIEILTRKEAKFIKAVDHVSFFVNRGESVGLVGESGCGKSTLSKTLIRLYKPTGGSVNFMDVGDISKQSSKQMKQLRFQMQMVFQDPYSSLNPKMTVRQVFYEVLSVHKICSKNKLEEKTVDLLNMVGMPEYALDRYPDEFSGGQRQRIGIARALAMSPGFLIADEPVSALDMSIQAQVINLLQELREKLNLTMLFISHDLRVVEYISDRVIVMYLGKIVEEGPTAPLFESPMHPYTEILIKAAPVMNPDDTSREYVIEGETPSPIEIPKGCRFHPRCPYATDLCREKEPQIEEIEKGRKVACHYPLSGQ